MPQRKHILESEPINISAEDETLPDEIDLDDAEETEDAAKLITLADEPLLVALLRQTVAKLWPNDTVMVDFVTHVAGPISEQLGTQGAKGGKFVEKQRQDGKEGTERYSLDQSFRAHLLNGLFPVLNLVRILTTWNAPRLRYLDEKARRLFIAGYVLHDWLKFSNVEEELKAVGLSHDTVNMTQHREIVEGFFRQWSARLGLPAFLAPIGDIESFLHDLIYLACNTQVKWGTLRNLSALPNLSLDERPLVLCENLCTLADLFAYIAPTPRDIVTPSGRIAKLISDLSDTTAKLVYHHVADNRGVLTNLIHNAALSATTHSLRIPFLFAPSGVVYLQHKDAPSLPDIGPVVEATIDRVRQVSAKQLSESLTGFKRDGKGLKRADYYDLFFDVGEQIVLAARAAFKHISSAKTPSAGKRFAKMRDGGWLDSSVDLDLADDIRVDQLAEWCYLVEAFINSSELNFDTSDFLLRELGLSDRQNEFDAVPRDNRAGGVGYHWYFAAGHYLKRNSRKDPAEWQDLVENLAHRLAEELLKKTTAATTNVTDSWQELRAYTQQILSFGPTTNAAEQDRTLFVSEFARYQDAKRTGRGRTSVCSLCSSPFATAKQQEAAILFAPQVYSNKLPLHGATAIRDICPICSLETMLRQILMNRVNIAGSKFEARQIRYLYFYPTYFFSPETLDIFRTLHRRLQRISFTELRRQLMKEDGSNGASNLRLDVATLQRLEEMLLSAETANPDSDRYIRMHFPEHEPITFYFLGIPPPSRDAKDAEAWVHPAVLALLLPVCVDVKVVASTSPLPLLLEATELEETVFLDGAHPFVRYLLDQERINIDEVLPRLQRLLVGCFIHLDAHSRQARGQWDYRWSDLPPLARDLSADAAYAFHYLKKWQRRNETDGIPLSKAKQYVNYITYLGEGGTIMNHAQRLVDLYRQFYQARRSNSNSILRPLSVAAKAILSADRNLFDRDGLITLVRGELQRFMERVRTDNADGLFARSSTAESRENAMREFAEYFVNKIFCETFRGDVAALRGRQLNLLKSATEVLYRDASRRDRQERKTQGEASEDEDDESNEQ